MNEQCFICDGTGLVCEKHPDRPLSGKYCCGCHATGTLCRACSEPASRFGFGRHSISVDCVFDLNDDKDAALLAASAERVLSPVHRWQFRVFDLDPVARRIRPHQFHWP